MGAARMGGLMLGYAQKGGIADVIAAAPKLVFFLGADEADFSKFDKSFKVFIGHHGDRGAHHADVVLPGASYAEKSGTRSEEHTSELQSLMRISYAVFCLKKKRHKTKRITAK